MKTRAVWMVWLGLGALALSGLVLFAPGLPFGERALVPAFVLFVAAGLATLTAFVLGLRCWRTGGVGITAGAFALLLAWAGVMLLGYLALNDFH